MAPRLYVIVYRGDPVDLQATRHTALFINEGSQETGELLHLAGSAGIFSFERRSNENPTKSQTFAKKIPVEPITKAPTRQQLVSKIAATPINNRSHSWNCQTWVGDALARLVGEDWLSRQSKSNAISSMADAIVEAKDEEE